MPVSITEAEYITHLKFACLEDKEPSGCVSLAAMLRYRGSPYDAAKVIHYCCKQTKVHKCCVQMGNIYFHGSGVEKNEERAKQCWKEVCDRGGSNGCFNMGLWHFKKNEVDIAKAFVKKGCEETTPPDPAACLLLSDIYNDGSDIKNTKNLAESLKYGQKACDLGLVGACRKMYKHYISLPDANVYENKVSALKYADKGCNMGDVSGCKVMYDYYASGLGMNEDQAEKKAKEYKDKIQEFSSGVKIS